MTVALAYLADLSRVRITATVQTGPTGLVERSTDQVSWTTVRGGAAVPIVAGSFVLDDYEFPAGQLVHYRVTDDNSTESASITVALTQVWLKSITRPFLNRPVVVSDFSEVTRPGRAGVFEIVGRSLPVAVTDVRVAGRQSVQLLTSDTAARRELATILASGDVVFLHCPPDAPLDTRYAVVGDVGEARSARRSPRRLFELPLTEVAPPDPSIVGSTVTWQNVINNFVSWSAVIAAEATWAELLDRIGDPVDVVVP